MNTLQKKSLFWDVSDVNPEKNERFIIERVLNFGDEIDFKWMLNFYGKERTVRNLLKNKSLDAKSLFFWCRYFNLDKEKCLANQLIKKQSAFWKR